MKNQKRIVILVVTAIMLLTFSMSASAATPYPNVTIKSTVLYEKSFTGH